MFLRLYNFQQSNHSLQTGWWVSSGKGASINWRWSFSSN